MHVGRGEVLPLSIRGGRGRRCGTALCLVVRIGVAYLVGLTAQLTVIAAGIFAPLSHVLKVFEAVEEVGEKESGDGSGDEDNGDECVEGGGDVV